MTLDTSHLEQLGHLVPGSAALNQSNSALAKAVE
jgi:hypothetical protein